MRQSRCVLTVLVRSACEPGASAPVRRRQDDALVDLDAERVGDRLDARERRAGVARRLVALDLLLLHAQPPGQLLLAQPGRDPGADQRLRQLGQRAQLELAHLAGAERVVLGQLLAQVGELALHALAHGLAEPRMEVGVLLVDMGERLLELADGGLRHAALDFVGDHGSAPRSSATMPLGRPSRPRWKNSKNVVRARSAGMLAWKSSP